MDIGVRREFLRLDEGMVIADAHLAETPVFQKYAAEIWNDAERCEFVSWTASSPTAGDLIPGSGGRREVRWSRSGQGRSA